MARMDGTKILMISYTSFIQKFYRTLPAEIARQSGAQVRVLLPPYWKELWSGGKKFLEAREDSGFETVVAPIYFPGNLHLSVFKRQLRHELRAFQPDIIDLEDEPFNAGSFQAAWLRGRLCPHSRLVLHASQHRFRRYPPPFNWMEKYVLRRADAILVRNEMARRVLLQKGYRGQLVTVTHGVDTTAFAPRRKRSGVNFPVVGFVGALEPHKGVHHLIGAMEGLPAKLLIVGEGSRKRALQELAAAARLDAQFLPAASHEQVAGYLNDMDIFVLPSLTMSNWIEKFGRVLIEAMACAVPVIGSSSGEIPNVIGPAGLVFREGDQRDLRAKIQLLIKNPEKRRLLGEAGRRRVEEFYSWPAVAARTLKVYRRILEEEKPLRKGAAG